jgi:hypothetical protein
MQEFILRQPVANGRSRSAGYRNRCPVERNDLRCLAASSQEYAEKQRSKPKGRDAFTDSVLAYISHDRTEYTG